MKIWKFIFFLMISQFIVSFSYAGSWKEEFAYAQTATYQKEVQLSFSKSGVCAMPTRIFFEPYFDHKIPRTEIYGDRKRATCITGFQIHLYNPTDNMVTIEWRNSAICVDGAAKGIPFLDGMKFKDAGVPAYTENDILPPKATLVRDVYTSDVYLRKGDIEYSSRWVNRGAILFRGYPRKFDYYISLSVSDGTRELLHIDIPEIKVPQ